MKFNFDGHSRDNLGNVGICCTIHSIDISWIVKQAKPFEIVSNNVTKLEALIEGLKISLEVGIGKLIIEGDSQGILNAIRKINTPNWILNLKL